MLLGGMVRIRRAAGIGLQLLIVLTVFASVLAPRPVAAAVESLESPVSLQADPPEPVVPKTILLVSDTPVIAAVDGSLSGGQILDRQLFAALADDYDVVSLADADLHEADLVGVDTVVLTASTSSANFERFLLKTTIPVMTMKPSSLTQLGLAPAEAGDATPLQNISSIEIEPTTHAITAGFSGQIQLFADNSSKTVAQGWTNETFPDRDGLESLAKGVEGSAIFAYAPGTPMGVPFPGADDVAQDCRVVFPGNKSRELSTSALALFASAIEWTATSTECGVQPVQYEADDGALVQLDVRPNLVTPSRDAQMCFVNPADESQALVNGQFVPTSETVEPNLSSLWVRALEYDPATQHLFSGGRFETAYDASERNPADDGPLVGGVSREGVFSCDLTTGAVTTFEVPIEIDPLGIAGANAIKNERVRALALDGNWLYIGGKFALDAGETPPASFPTRSFHNLIRVDKTNGAIDYSWAPDIRGGVSALEVGSDGYLYVGGGLHTTFIGGEAETLARLTRVNIAEAHPEFGLVDLAFRPILSPSIPSGGNYFANVLALDIVGNTLVAAGTFEWVNDTPSTEDWAAYVATGGTSPMPQANAGQRRNSVAAFTLGASPAITGFHPSIGDNNFGTDEAPQIKDIAHDESGNVFLCGDWWLTNPNPGFQWTPYDHDGPDDNNDNDGEPNPNGPAWEGQFSKKQPRPNQHNFGKFELGSGASALGPHGVWGATTDGGVQGCDYDLSTNTLIIGGHYESIGAYEEGFVPPNEDAYPSSHRSLEKANAIDGETGLVLEWDPDIDSVRGLDAVRVIPGATPAETRVAVGGAFTESDRMNREGLALYDFRTPRVPPTEEQPDWELHRVEAAATELGAGTISQRILSPQELAARKVPTGRQVPIPTTPLDRTLVGVDSWHCLQTQ